jgi:hypothetical protein
MRTVASIVLAAVVFAVPVQAGEPRVVIGEVSSRVGAAGTSYEPLMRTASEAEVSALDLSRVPRDRRVIVSVALVRLDTFDEALQTDATCEVSATLRDAKRGTVFAILEGKSRVKSGAARGAVESSVVHGAIHGALAHIPDVLRR